MSATELLPLVETPAMEEARRAMEVCNACRYCEGFCAVFPAMELRRDFASADLTYLANLCHGCQGCFYACQYAPPHPFGVNVPRVFSELRAESYEAYAWPRPLATLFRRNGTVLSVVAALGIAIILLGTMAFQDPAVLYRPQLGPGAFYRVIPWGLLALLAGASLIYAIVALAIGTRNFWRDMPPMEAAPNSVGGALRALHDVFALRNLGGGGGGCNDKDEAFSMARRRFHHGVFYGFLLCFASTTVATFYDHFLGLSAPYPFFSLPVLLGTVGGISLVIGLAGLLRLKILADPEPVARALLGGDYAFSTLLLLVTVTGLLLLALRGTGAMGVLLAVHFGLVLALFLTMPYGKFVHGIYRSAALLRNALEQQTAAPAAGD